MLDRRLRTMVLVGLTILVVCCGSVSWHSGGSGSGTTVAAELADLQDRLQNGLRTRAPGDIAFIKQVVELVETGKLSVNDVLGVYRWAEPKRPHPFPYFREAMRRLARRQGINL